MSYSLYSDKVNKFNCNIDVEGTSLSNSKARLVIETNDLSYIFNGKINDSGICEVEIPKTKNFLPEGTKGNIKLEVIADDVFFEPWNSDFNVKTSKKVNVVVQEQQEEKPKLRVTINEQKIEPEKKIEKSIPSIKKEKSEKLVLTKDQLERLINKKV